MANRSAKLIAIVGLLAAAGCMQRHVLRMATPERSSTVTLLDQGNDAVTDDDRVTVLDDSARIARVAEFLQARAEKWRPYLGKVNLARRYQISFRKDDEVTDRFWITRDALFLHAPSGEYYSCDLSDSERVELIGLFSEMPADPPRGARG